jgi:hypothetical protein
VKVNVPSMSLTAAPTTIASGGSTTLNWSGAYVWNCMASGAWSGSRSRSGSEVRAKLTRDETYTLTCDSGIGEVVAMTSVSVSSGTGIRLYWQPPTQNIDGSPLTDLDRYHIHIGTASGRYDQRITVEDETRTTRFVELPPGEYYIAMTAVDADGNEGPYSNEVRRIVP